MNVSRFGFESPNRDTIEQQRTTVDFDDTSIAQLSRRARELFEASIFQQLAGADPTTITVDGTTYSTAAEKVHVLGHNTVVAPTSERVVRAASAATDQALTANDTMTLDLVDASVELAETSGQALERLDNDQFDLYVHPYQLTDLKRDNAGGVQWYTNELAYAQGGDVDDNKLKKGIMQGKLCAGVYNDTMIYSASRVAQGVNSSSSAAVANVRRAVLTGRNAAAYSSPYGGRITDRDVPVKFFYQYRDFDYYKAVECRLIYGIKKMTFPNEQDWGSLVVSTYAAAHS